MNGGGRWALFIIEPVVKRGEEMVSRVDCAEQFEVDEFPMKLDKVSERYHKNMRKGRIGSQ